MENTATTHSTPFFRRLLIVLGKSILFAVLAGIFVWLLSQPIGTLLNAEQINALNAGDMSRIQAGVLNLLYLILVVGSMASLFIVRQLISKQPLRSAGLGFFKWQPEFGEGWILGAVLVIIGYLLMLISGMARSTGQEFIFSTFLWWILFFLIQPFFEELIFRGFLMSLLGRYFNLKVALIVSSFAFAIVHADNDGFSIISFVTITLAGFLFGLLFMKSGQLWLPTGMHAAWNFMQGVVFGFPTSGVKTYALLDTTTSGPAWLSGGTFGFEGSILAILLMLAAIWWYRGSWKQERLSAIMNLSLNPSKIAIPDEEKGSDANLP
ncbi:MAG: type II CAAX endopeptidase family protein [Saprospiraceae bacterium]|nr:CPBP family intramembrane metalloprotease [Lewinella sp.]